MDDVVATPVRPYRILLGTPHVAALYGWALLARSPLGMVPLGTVLLVRASSGSYADAGVVTACYSIALGAGSPLAGRLVDRLGQTRVLAPRALLFPAALVGLALLAERRAPLAALAVCAALAGALVPPVGAALRATWPRLLPVTELRASAYAFDAALQEVFFLLGPVLVAALAAAFDPSAALFAAAVAGGAGTLAFVRVAPVRDWRPDPARGRPGLLGALASRDVRTVLAVSTGCGLAFGATEVAMPAFAELHGGRALAGAILACFSAGSLAGGIVAGLRPHGDARARLRVSVTALAAGLALPLAAGSLAAMCLLVFAAGLAIAPTFGSAYSVVDETAPPGTQAEAFSWIGTAITAGIAAGTAAGGFVVDAHGVRAALLLGVGGGALAAACAVARR